MKEKLEMVKSIAILLLLALSLVQAVLRGEDASDVFKRALDLAPHVEGLVFDSVRYETEGPPLASDMVIVLKDGREIHVLKNGEILVRQ